MVILGIDPGFATVGFGVIDYVGNHFKVLDYGVMTTPAHTPFSDRLAGLYEQVTELLQRYKPDAVSIEELFFNTNQKTAITVAEARGVMLLCAVNNGLKIYEYTPLQVKQAVVGYGRAEKKQVIAMVVNFLNLEKKPKLDDTADALAIAVCHAHTNGSLLSKFQ